LSSERSYNRPNSNISGVETSEDLTVNFVPNAVSKLLNADSMTKIVIETQEDALSSNNNNNNDNDNEEDDD
jgi:hypothetical protein